MGIGLLVWALVSAHGQFEFKRHAAITDGTVQALHPPVIEFATASGASHTFTPGMSGRRNPGFLGQKVKVAYLAHRPERAEMEEYIWVMPLVIGSWSAFLLIFGWLAYRGKLADSYQ